MCVFFAGVTLRDPVARFLAQSTAVAQHAQFGDGGLLAAHVACHLVLAAPPSGTPAASRLAYAAACQQALAW